ncbi:hypothetical protein EV05_1116 [Prochlorococcus sp. MIT 0601]|nr:hypothetical protein EV05_1116 [Prochlorococcus sp. MIT 0601]
MFKDITIKILWLGNLCRNDRPKVTNTFLGVNNSKEPLKENLHPNRL